MALALARAEEERVANGSNGLLSVSSMPSSDASKEAFSHMFGPDTVIAVHTSNRQHIAELCALGCHFVSSKPSDLTSVLFLYRVLPSLLDSRRNAGAAPTINTHGNTRLSLCFFLPPFSLHRFFIILVLYHSLLDFFSLYHLVFCHFVLYHLFSSLVPINLFSITLFSSSSSFLAQRFVKQIPN